jgi:hypothetical protein
MEIREKLSRWSELSEESLQHAPFCLAAIWRATLRREVAEIVLEVWVEDDPFVAINQEERMVLERAAGKNWRRNQLDEFFRGEKKTIEIASADSPMVMSAGGALPLLRLRNGQEFFLLIQRDIAPYAWNTASGLSSNLEEIYTPGKVVFRETFEEFLITVDEQAFAWRTSMFDSTNIIKNNLAMWGQEKEILPRSFAVRANAQKYQLIAHCQDVTTALSENILLTIHSTGINALIIPGLEVPVETAARMRIYGCEEWPTPGVPLDPVIGLLAVEEARKLVQHRLDSVMRFDAVFKSGAHCGPWVVDSNIIANKVKELKAAGLPLDELFRALTPQEQGIFMASRFCATASQAIQAFFA